MTASGLLVEPAWFTAPDYYQTFGPEVGELAALANFPPDPEQSLVLDPMFGVDRKGRSAAFEVAVIGCRQNIKTGLMKIAALGKTVIMERPLFVWSAHEFRTAQEAFRDLTILIESCPDLDQLVKRIYRGNGDESIEWLGGQRIIFKARTKAGGKGLTGDDVGLDEGFALQPVHMGSLLPTLSARPDPQVIYGSSAGYSFSEVLRGVRDRGRVGDPRLVYVEWCAPDPSVACDLGDRCPHTLETVGCGCDKPEHWQAGNSQMGRRIPQDQIAAERRALTPGEFARERMGWWDLPDLEVTALDPRKWRDALDPTSQMDVLAGFALDVTPDRSLASIGAAGWREDGLLHVELIEPRPDMGRLIDTCREIDEAQGPLPWAVDPNGPAASLIPELQAAGLEVVELTARQVAQCCVWIADQIDNGKLRHGPQDVLSKAVTAARRKDVGDGMFRFTRHDSVTDISPLMAVTLPCYSLLTSMPLDDVTVGYL